MPPELSEVEVHSVVTNCLARLREDDEALLRNDVSERAIAHKLAEYLQQQVPGLDVDCEYNRNVELGEGAQKTIYVLKGQRRREIGKMAMDEEQLLAVSTFPDIIVHERETNTRNLLILEVKKRNSTVSDEFDLVKLRAFTDSTCQVPYSYGYGVFIRLTTGPLWQTPPELIWVTAGRVRETFPAN